MAWALGASVRRRWRPSPWRRGRRGGCRRANTDLVARAEAAVGTCTAWACVNPSSPEARQKLGHRDGEWLLRMGRRAERTAADEPDGKTTAYAGEGARAAIRGVMGVGKGIGTGPCSAKKERLDPEVWAR